MSLARPSWHTLRWGRRWVGLAAAALAGAMALVWWHSGETTAATLAAVVAAVLAAIGPFTSWLPAPAGTGRTIEGQLERLAATVRIQWEVEADIRQLRDPQPLTVRWSEAHSELTDHIDVVTPASRRPRQSHRLPAKRSSLVRGVDHMVRELHALPRRRLV